MSQRQQESSPGAAARAAILRAAISEFTTKGLAGARMAAIAKAAGVAKGLVFHHFGSKDELWAAALEHVYRLLRSGQDEVALMALGPIEGMRRLTTETFRLFREHPEITALMNEENLHRGRHLRAATKVPLLYSPLFATMERLLEEGRRQGLFRSDVDVRALYVALSGLGYFPCANRWTLSAAFAGDLFEPDRLVAYEALAGEMVVSFLLRREDSTAPRRRTVRERRKM
ncbi:TetR family transcriptional regulator [Sabulicella glaciei]|nr:TetR family transcriptional regulator [Roseococcus sp. MDT2-1-1]